MHAYDVDEIDYSSTTSKSGKGRGEEPGTRFTKIFLTFS